MTKALQSALTALLSVICVPFLAAPPAAAAKLNVVVTLKPIHSLVAQVMDGIGTPTVLIDGAQSPHSFSLKPSGAKAVSSADVFIRVSPAIESFTNKLLMSLPDSVVVVTLTETPGLRLLAQRQGDRFEAHAHDGEPEQGTDGHAEEHEAHEEGQTDGHIWLDPDNAKLIVAHIADVLAARSPEDAVRLNANAAAVGARIDVLAAEIEGATRPLQGRPFVVFHDAYQYFEKRFGLTAVGSITLNPDRPPSAKRLTSIRQKMESLGATCVFAEPNQHPNVVSAVIESTTARSGLLDPEGTTIAPGTGHYAVLMRQLAAGLKDCLQAGS